MKRNCHIKFLIKTIYFDFDYRIQEQNFWIQLKQLLIDYNYYYLKELV